jgi:uncharacterized protein YbjT (DUF2867 family)
MSSRSHAARAGYLRRMSEAARSVLLLGATGLVGAELLRQLLADQTVGRVVALTRRPLENAGLDTLRNEIVDFNRLSDHAELFAVDQIVCALGTTIKQAGSQDAFRHVDFDIPLAAAKLGVEHGVKDFLLVSALGASARSRVFYNRVKGELEDALRTLPFRSVTIARPSMLIGIRAEPRVGEEVAKRLGWMAPGRYKPIRASRVAAALVAAARSAEPGMRILESDELQRFSAND